VLQFDATRSCLCGSPTLSPGFPVCSQGRAFAQSTHCAVIGWFSLQRIGEGFGTRIPLGTRHALEDACTALHNHVSR
jgi:hypothetical protein